MIIQERRKLHENRRVMKITKRAKRQLNEQALAGISQFSSPQGRRAAMQFVQGSSGDAVMLYKAMKGWGTDEDTIYAILRKRASTIPQLYNEWNSLMAELKQASSGFMGKVKKYGLPFLTGSGLFALATFLDPDKGRAVDNFIEDSTQKMNDYVKGTNAPEFVKDASGAVANADSPFGGTMSALQSKETYGKNAPDWAFDGDQINLKGKLAGAALSGAAVAGVAALISAVVPDSLDDDLVDWLEDDGEEDAAQFVLANLNPGQRPYRG